MAEVLSPSARMQAKGVSLLSEMSKRTFTAKAKNSNTLLTVSSPRIGEVAPICFRHAVPLRVYPPSPNGQESDQATAVGTLVVKRFREIPALA